MPRRNPYSQSPRATNKFSQPPPSGWKKFPKKTYITLKRIESGAEGECPGCGNHVKYVARKHGFEVVANIYTSGVWRRVEHWHYDCYQKTKPYGDAGKLPENNQGDKKPAQNNRRKSA